MNRTITVRRDYLHYIKKYNRYEKRHSMTSAHCSPCFIGLKEGDTVTIGQCRYHATAGPPVAPILCLNVRRVLRRPLSKTVRYNVLRVDKAESGGKQFGGM